jgi:hypothetical protein
MELEGSLQAALAASAFLLNSDGDVASAHRLLVPAIQSRPRPDEGADPLLEEALNTLMMVCYYGGQADLWQRFHEIADTVTIPLEVIQHSKTFADPARATHADRGARRGDQALARMDPTRIVRTGSRRSTSIGWAAVGSAVARGRGRARGRRRRVGAPRPDH